MLYVVVEELIPEMSKWEHSNVGVMAFDLGFSLMMALVVALGKEIFSLALIKLRLSALWFSNSVLS